jgi:hypothetical protein
MHILFFASRVYLFRNRILALALNFSFRKGANSTTVDGGPAWHFASGTTNAISQLTISAFSFPAAYLPAAFSR